MTKVQVGTIHTSQGMDCQAHAIRKAIRPLFTDQVTNTNSSSRDISDISLGRTHLIGERTNENSSHLFNKVASEYGSWF